MDKYQVWVILAQNPVLPIFLNPNSIHICIWPNFENRISFVFVFGPENTICSPLADSNQKNNLNDDQPPTWAAPWVGNILLDTVILPWIRLIRMMMFVRLLCCCCWWCWPWLWRDTESPFGSLSALDLPPFPPHNSDLYVVNFLQFFHWQSMLMLILLYLDADVDVGGIDNIF